MDTNHNVKKTVGTSIITILIIAFGLFLVCGVRPPQPTIEDSAVDSANFGNDEFGDGDLAGFLEDGDGEDINTSESGASTTSENEAEVAAWDETDDDMGDIMNLLDSGDDYGDDDSDLFAFDDSDFSDGGGTELASVSDLSSSASSSEEADQFEGSMTNENFEEMSKEADRLTEVLDEKTQTSDSLKEVLQGFDEKIAVIELENSGAGYAPPASNYTPPKPAASSNSYASTSSYAGSDYSESPAPRSVSRSSSRSSTKANFDSKYDTALNTFNSGKYSVALRNFEELLNKEPGNQLADNCQYWIGECFMAMKDYTRAVLEYEKVFGFDDRENADDAQFKIGLSFLESGNRKMAKHEFDSLLDFYADSELVREARNHLQRL